MRNMQTVYTPNGNNCQKVAVPAASPQASAPISDQCYTVDIYSTNDIYVSIDIPVSKTGSTVGNVTTGLSYFVPKLIPTRLAVDGKCTLNMQADSADAVVHISELTS